MPLKGFTAGRKAIEDKEIFNIEEGKVPRGLWGRHAPTVSTEDKLKQMT